MGIKKIIVSVQDVLAAALIYSLFNAQVLYIGYVSVSAHSLYREYKLKTHIASKNVHKYKKFSYER